MQKNIKVSGIKWDADDMNDVKGIPADMTIQVPDHIDLDDEDDLTEYISDEISNQSGFTHDGWEGYEIQLILSDMEEFDEMFKPIENPFVGEGCYHFETYGEEYDMVLKALENDSKTVWTIVDGEDGNMYLQQGWHFVDRVHYVITEEAAHWPVKDILYHQDSEMDDDQESYCVTAVFDNEPDANHTKWFETHDEAMAYIETLGDDANAAVGKRLSLDTAQSLIAEGTEVCFIFDDGTESVYEGGDIDEMYAGLPLATYSI